MADQVFAVKTGYSGSGANLTSIPNSALTNSSITVGSTSISLGSTATTITGLTLTSPVISSISNTGTITFPTSTDTLVGRATTDTLTNKTLTSPVISTISNIGTLTLPTSTDTLIGRDTTDTLTNKSISGSTNTLSNIPNNALTNSSITINGSSVALGGSVSITTIPTQTNNSGKFLTTNGTDASWSSVSLTTGVSGTLPISSGGTNITSYSTGDILYASNTNVLSKLSAGTEGYVLTMLSGMPAWKASSATGGVSGTIILLDGGFSNSTYSGSGGTSLAQLDGGSAV